MEKMMVKYKVITHYVENTFPKERNHYFDTLDEANMFVAAVAKQIVKVYDSDGKLVETRNLA
jgi:hypothetical protein